MNASEKRQSLTATILRAKREAAKRGVSGASSRELDRAEVASLGSNGSRRSSGVLGAQHEEHAPSMDFSVDFPDEMRKSVDSRLSDSLDYTSQLGGSRRRLSAASVSSRDGVGLYQMERLSRSNSVTGASFAQSFRNVPSLSGASSRRHLEEMSAAEVRTMGKTLKAAFHQRAASRATTRSRANSHASQDSASSLDQLLASVPKAPEVQHLMESPQGRLFLKVLSLGEPGSGLPTAPGTDLGPLFRRPERSDAHTSRSPSPILNRVPSFHSTPPSPPPKARSAVPSTPRSFAVINRWERLVTRLCPHLCAHRPAPATEFEEALKELIVAQERHYPRLDVLNYAFGISADMNVATRSQRYATLDLGTANRGYSRHYSLFPPTPSVHPSLTLSRTGKPTSSVPHPRHHSFHDAGHRALHTLYPAVTKVHRAASSMRHEDIEAVLDALEQDVGLPPALRAYFGFLVSDADMEGSEMSPGSQEPRVASHFLSAHRQTVVLRSLIHETVLTEDEYIRSLITLSDFFRRADYETHPEVLHFIAGHPSLTAIASAGRALIPLNFALLKIFRDGGVFVPPPPGGWGTAPDTEAGVLEEMHGIIGRARTFVQAFHQLKDLMHLYGSFVANHDGAAQRLLRAPPAVRDAFAAASEEVANGESIHSLLIRPVQRIPRYLLLLKEMGRTVQGLERLCAAHEDLSISEKLDKLARELAVVIEGITAATDTTNEAAREAHDRALLHRLWRLLQPIAGGSRLPMSFVRPGRRFLMEGPLWGLSESQKKIKGRYRSQMSRDARPGYWCWLFSNILIISSHKFGATRPPGLAEVEEREFSPGPHRGGLSSTPTFLRYAVRFAASNCSFHRLPYVEPFLNSFVLCTGDGLLTLTAASKKDADNWSQRLLEAIDEADGERRLRPSSVGSRREAKVKSLRMHVHRHQSRLSTADSMPSAMAEILSLDEDDSDSTHGLIAPRELQWWAQEQSGVANQQLLLGILAEFEYPAIHQYIKNPTNGLEVETIAEEERRRRRSSLVLGGSAPPDSLPLPVSTLARAAMALSARHLIYDERGMYRYWVISQHWCFDLTEQYGVGPTLIRVCVFSGVLVFQQVSSVGVGGAKLLAAAPLERLTATPLRNDPERYMNAVLFSCERKRPDVDGPPTAPNGMAPQRTSVLSEFDWTTANEDAFPPFAPGYTGHGGTPRDLDAAGFNCGLNFESETARKDFLRHFWVIKHAFHKARALSISKPATPRTSYAQRTNLQPTDGAASTTVASTFSEDAKPTPGGPEAAAKHAHDRKMSVELAMALDKLAVSSVADEKAQASDDPRDPSLRQSMEDKRIDEDGDAMTFQERVSDMGAGHMRYASEDELVSSIVPPRSASSNNWATSTRSVQSTMVEPGSFMGSQRLDGLVPNPNENHDPNEETKSEPPAPPPLGLADDPLAKAAPNVAYPEDKLADARDDSLANHIKKESAMYVYDAESDQVFVRRPLKKNRDNDASPVMSPTEKKERRRKASSVERLFNGPLPTMMAQPHERTSTVGILPSKMGWLYKETQKGSGGNVLNFNFGSPERKRFFVLRFGTLCYYRTEQEFERDADPARGTTMQVKECIAVACPETGDACFEVQPVTPQAGERTVKLRAESRTAMSEWLEALMASGARPMLRVEL